MGESRPTGSAISFYADLLERHVNNVVEEMLDFSVDYLSTTSATLSAILEGRGRPHTLENKAKEVWDDPGHQSPEVWPASRIRTTAVEMGRPYSYQRRHPFQRRLHRLHKLWWKMRRRIRPALCRAKSPQEGNLSPFHLPSTQLWRYSPADAGAFRWKSVPKCQPRTQKGPDLEAAVPIPLQSSPAFQRRRAPDQ